jgi:hypothetical protein
MGGGRAPGPLGGPTDHTRIDAGTLARTASPPPGSVGLGGKGGAKEAGTAAPSPSAAPAESGVDYARIVSYAHDLVRRRVGNGQCFTLVDRALRGAGAASAAAYGPIGPDDDYVWGSPVDLADLQPGDVVQFRDYACECVFGTVDQQGRYTYDGTETEPRPHHSAIVHSIQGGGAVTVIEQNAPPGASVRETQLFFASDTFTVDGVRTTVTVAPGSSFHFYRPQPE